MTDVDLQQFREMRRFYLVRHEDESGISGTGLIACGVAFPPPNDRVILGWLTDTNSVAIYDSVDELIDLHGHDGKTEVVFPEDLQVDVKDPVGVEEDLTDPQAEDVDDDSSAEARDDQDDVDDEDQDDVGTDDRVFCGTCGDGFDSERAAKIHHGQSDDHDGDADIWNVEPDPDHLVDDEDQDDVEDGCDDQDDVDEDPAPQGRDDDQPDDPPRGATLPEGLTEGDLAAVADVEEDVAGVATNMEIDEDHARDLLQQHGLADQVEDVEPVATDGGDPVAWEVVSETDCDRYRTIYEDKAAAQAEFSSGYGVEMNPVTEDSNT